MYTLELYTLGGESYMSNEHNGLQSGKRFTDIALHFRGAIYFKTRAVDNWQINCVNSEREGLSEIQDFITV